MSCSAVNDDSPKNNCGTKHKKPLSSGSKYASPLISLPLGSSKRAISACPEGCKFLNAKLPSKDASSFSDKRRKFRARIRSRFPVSEKSPVSLPSV